MEIGCYGTEGYGTEGGPKQSECVHCWHVHSSPFYMVLKDGHVLQDCCRCGASRQVHRDHAIADSHKPNGVLYNITAW